MLKKVEVTSVDAERALDYVSPIIMSLVAVGAIHGAYIRIGDRESGERLAERGYGTVMPRHDLDFKILSEQKYAVVNQRGISMRAALGQPHVLGLGECKLHPGALLFGTYIISVAGLNNGSEMMAFVLAQYLDVLYVPADPA